MSSTFSSVIVLCLMLKALLKFLMSYVCFVVLSQSDIYIYIYIHTTGCEAVNGNV